jgi:hypothetical protein
MTNPLTYEEWCGITGRRHIKGYEAYLEDEAADAAADAAENAKQEVESYIYLPRRHQVKPEAESEGED